MMGEQVEQEREYYEDLCRRRSDWFSYLPLNKDVKEIRLIKVRGPFEDDIFTPEGIQKSEEDAEFRLENEKTFVIKAEIARFPLEKTPPYAALSYTWGDNTVKRPVFFVEDLEDVECKEFKLFEVTENLFQALRQLKRMKDVEYLWVDAICINQNDSTEKSWQVAQMWEIYQRSRFVRIWLGPGGTATNTLMEEMHNTIGTLVNTATDPQGLKLDDCKLPDTFRLLSDFQSFTERSYWKRAWTRQELSAQQPDNIWISWGRRTVHFQILYYFIHGIKNVAQDVVRQQAGTMASHRQQVVSAIASSSGFVSVQDSLDSCVSEKARLIHILETWLRKIYLWGDGMLASDPRDLLFSLFWMTHWKDNDDRERLQVDYTKDTREVFIDIVKYWPKLITWRNDPNDSGGSDLNLPSWVPDWRRRIRPVHYLELRPWEGNTELQYDAGNMRQYKGGYSIKPSRYSQSAEQPCFVFMEGFVLDTVEDVGPRMVRDQAMTAESTCRWWVSQLIDLTKRRDTPAELGIARLSLSTATATGKHAAMSKMSRWRVPIMDVGVVKGSIGKVPEDYSRAYEFFEASESSLNLRNNENLEVMISRYAKIALAACNGKRFFVSKNGFCGIGFPGIESGDLIVVFPGLMVPLILRRVKDKGYRIIGDSYVEGVMYGETKDDVGGVGFKLEEFAIF